MLKLQYSKGKFGKWANMDIIWSLFIMLLKT